MTIVEQIESSNVDLGTKIVQLAAVAMVEYRKPPGESAWEAMRRLAGRDYVNALAFLMGFCAGQPTDERWKALLPKPKTTATKPKTKPEPAPTRKLIV